MRIDWWCHLVLLSLEDFLGVEHSRQEKNNLKIPIKHMTLIHVPKLWNMWPINQYSSKEVYMYFDFREPLTLLKLSRFGQGRWWNDAWIEIKWTRTFIVLWRPGNRTNNFYKNPFLPTLFLRDLLVQCNIFFVSNACNARMHDHSECMYMYYDVQLLISNKKIFRTIRTQNIYIFYTSIVYVTSIMIYVTWV